MLVRRHPRIGGYRRYWSLALGQLDHYFSSLLGETEKGKSGQSPPKFFGKGYGSTEPLIQCEQHALDILCDRRSVPAIFIKTEQPKKEHSRVCGDFNSEKWSFESPFAAYLPDECKTVFCEYIYPTKGGVRAVAIIFPATGDQYFAMRRNLLSTWLLRRGIGSVLIMAPGYGKRRPKEQRRFFIDDVSLYLRTLSALTVEGAALALNIKRRLRVPVVLTGMSFGGAMAAASSLLVDGPVGVVPYIGSASAAVMSEGLMRHAIDTTAIDTNNEGPDAALAAVGQQLLNRSMLSYLKDVDVLAAAYMRNRSGPRICMSISAKDDHFVSLKEGYALDQSMRVLFTEGLQSNPVSSESGHHDDKDADKGHDDKYDGKARVEHDPTLAIRPNNSSSSVSIEDSLVQHKVISGGHASAMAVAPLVLVTEIDRVVRSICTASANWNPNSDPTSKLYTLADYDI